MITLVTSRIRDKSPDILLLQTFEQFCSRNSGWITKQGPILFHPRKISSRLYTLIHKTFKPLLRSHKLPGAVVSLGMPYQKYIFSKSFPYFSYNYELKVFWTYDVWEPDFKKVEELVRTSQTNLLLLSSHQATEHFKKLNIAGCEVHWIPESINTEDYKFKPWNERKVQVLSFGRSYENYHSKIVIGCQISHINYLFQERDEYIDVAVQGMNQSLQFPTWENFVDGLADAQICICFPRSITHPELAGSVSTLTLRYLQAMASKCLIIGSAPLDAQHLFDYNPVIEVDWADPTGQIKRIIQNPEAFQVLIEKNYHTVCTLFHHKNALSKIENLINSHLNH